MTPLKVTTAPARGSATRAASASSDSGTSRTATWSAASPPDTGGISASSSPGASGCSARCVLAVDGHDERHAGGEVADGGQGVGHPRALGQVELELGASGALAQAGEQADGDDHTSSRCPATSQVHSSTTWPKGSVTNAARLSS